MTDLETVTRALAGPLVNARATSAGVAPCAPTPGRSRIACGIRRRASETARAWVAPTTALWRALPAENFGTVAAGIVTFSPGLRGFTPWRAARFCVENLPKPVKF